MKKNTLHKDKRSQKNLLLKTNRETHKRPNFRYGLTNQRLKSVLQMGFCKKKKGCIFAPIGEMAEWSNAAVLKTVEGHTSGGSNPSFSAVKNQVYIHLVFFYAY